jgi:GNAT superfamily N-acetyltransferase
MANQGQKALTFETRAPEPLIASHAVDQFDCGVVALNDWLQRRALANQLSGATRTFVVTDVERAVLGYYALAAGAVALADATGAVRRNMPNPVPVIVLARLAVDLRMQGRRLGASLLKDAVYRVVGVSHEAGVRAMLIHAIDDQASRFYQHYGFQMSPVHPLTLMLRLPTRNRAAV